MLKIDNNGNYRKKEGYVKQFYLVLFHWLRCCKRNSRKISKNMVLNMVIRFIRYWVIFYTIWCILYMLCFFTFHHMFQLGVQNKARVSPVPLLCYRYFSCRQEENPLIEIFSSCATWLPGLSAITNRCQKSLKFASLPNLIGKQVVVSYFLPYQKVCKIFT